MVLSVNIILCNIIFFCVMFYILKMPYLIMYLFIFFSQILVESRLIEIMGLPKAGSTVSPVGKKE